MKKLLISFFLFTNCLSIVTGTQAAIPASERETLILFYNSTNGDSWSYNSGWKTPPLYEDGFAMPGTEGSWYGVFTDSSDTNVIYIYITGNQLSGSIPPELDKLTALQDLELDHNQLTGSIPPKLGNMTSLIWLGLNGNQLTGSIPPELGNMTELQNLDLSNNQLTGSIPSTLTNLTHLEDLGSNICGNHLFTFDHCCPK